MPGAENHAIEVIFQDYHIKLKVEIVADTPRKEKNKKSI